MFIQKRKITADDAVDAPVVVDEVAKAADAAPDAEVAPEASELLFETEEVAQLLAEVTGETVDVELDDENEAVKFTVGDDEFTVHAEGDEEILESRRVGRGKREVAASTKLAAKPQGRTVRRIVKK